MVEMEFGSFGNVGGTAYVQRAAGGNIMASGMHARKLPGRWPLQARLAGTLAFLPALLSAFLPAGACASGPPAEAHFTPILLAVPSPPVPFTGSDGHVHLAYELQLTNFTSSVATVSHVDVFGDGRILATLDEGAVDGRLEPFARRKPVGTMAPSTGALLFLHLTLPAGTAPPKRLAHRVTARFARKSDPVRELTVSGGDVAAAERKPVVIGPPLAGDGYIAADSCCDSTRHVRAALPVNGQLRLAQRYAVDWEQLDRQGRIYAGGKEAKEAPRSYTIYGKEALAVANARVAATLDGLPEQIPGQYPKNIPIEQADGNSVVLDLGDGNYALYAHLQPGSLRVKQGEQVTRGQVLGLVGNSGNSVAPHLHFHVMDGPSPLGSNGLPYHIDAFTVSGHTPGTADFDAAERDGTQLTVTPAVPPLGVRNALPMDQTVIRFVR
jgi:hypothetical protein